MFTARALASLHGGGGRGRGHGVGGDVGGIKIEILKLPLLQITSNYRSFVRSLHRFAYLFIRYQLREYSVLV